MKRSAASVTVKLRGGPFDGQSAVAYGAIVGSLIEVNHRPYRVTKIDPVPGRREETGHATFEPRPEAKPVVVAKPVAPKPTLKPQI